MTRPTRQRDHDRQRVRDEDADESETDAEGVEDLLGYRHDPAPGLAHRITWFEYGDEVDEALYFRLFSPDRLREAAEATGWEVADIIRPNDPIEYRAALQKR